MIYDLDYTVNAVMFGKVTQPVSPWNKGYHAPSDIVLYCTDGEINMTVDGKEYHLDIGDILIIPKKSFYRPLKGGLCRYYFFHMEAVHACCIETLPTRATVIPHAELIDGFGFTYDQHRSLIDVPLYTKNVSVDIRNLFTRASLLKPESCFFDKLLMDNLLRELIICLGKNNTPHSSKKLDSIANYIAAHYTEPLTLTVLAKHFKLSPSYIARMFRNELGIKPSAYIHQVKIAAAKALLLESDMSINEISEKLGYSDIYYFSKVFKRLIGSSPLQFRGGKQ